MAHEVEIRTEITIAAPPAVVWRVLTDFAGYAAWNPMVQEAEGVAVVGSLARLRYRSSVGVPLRFLVRITRADAARELRWLGSRLRVEGDHYYQLSERDGATRFVHGEVFRGLLAKPLARVFRAQVPVFEAFNEALRREAEALAGAH